MYSFNFELDGDQKLLVPIKDELIPFAFLFELKPNCTGICRLDSIISVLLLLTHELLLNVYPDRQDNTPFGNIVTPGGYNKHLPL
jgi:hypothetical protein